MGTVYGLVLCILVGPIFFKILQTSIENGFRAGFMLAAGQWLGDLMYISAVFYGAQYIADMLADEAFKQQFIFYLGTIGGSMLVLMGGSMMRASVSIPDAALQQSPQNSNATLWKLFAQGWLVNTINPFPLFFWVTMMGTAIGENFDQANTIGIFAGTMGTVIATDLLKITLAKGIRHYLRPSYLVYVRRIAAAALMIFGILLLIRSITQ